MLFIPKTLLAEDNSGNIEINFSHMMLNTVR